MFNKTAITPQKQKLIVYIFLTIITFAGLLAGTSI